MNRLGITAATIRRVALLTLCALLATSLAALAGASAQGPGAAGGCPAGSGAWRVGSAKADITPTLWPVGEGAYSIGRMAVGAAHPFYARAIALQSCANGQTIVLTALDSQGYFAGYKEDPGPGVDGFGTAAIRQTVARDTGVPVANLLIAATHTHNSPDSVGVWGGGTVANNKAPYLGRVKAQTVLAMEAALAALRPANLRVGTADVSSALGTYSQVARDPADYPTDHVMRVLQATDARSCAPIATLVNAGIHADIAGPIEEGHGQLIDPDWPGRVASDLERQLPGDGAVVMAGAVGRTGPSFPSGTDPNSHDQLVEIGAYGDVLARRAVTAITDSQAVVPGPAQAVETHMVEELGEPALVALFADEMGIPQPGSSSPALGGVMRSILPPFSTGPTVSADLQTLRLGSLLLAGAPGEAYPEVASELAKRVRAQSPPFVFGLAEDQLGYTPPAFEYPVVALVDGGDEGFFTINSHFGDDIINQHLSAAQGLGFSSQTGYNGATAGPVSPPDQNATYPQPPNPSEPVEKPLALPCGDGSTSGAGAPSHVQVAGVADVRLPSTRRCVSRRRFTIHFARHRGVRIISALVSVHGRRLAVRFGRRLRTTVDLRGLPPGMFRVQVLLRVRSHGHTRTLRATRSYRTCVVRRSRRR